MGFRNTSGGSDRSRRTFLKNAAAATTVGLVGLSGCTGQQAADTPTPAVRTVVQTKVVEETRVVERTLTPEPDELAEWRKMASERAFEELKGNEQLNYYTSARDQNYLAMRTSNLGDTLRQAWVADAELYQPLVGNINSIAGSRGDLVTRYAQENQAGRQIMDLLEGGAGSAIAEGVPFGDVTQVPTTGVIPEDNVVPFGGTPQQVALYLFPFGPSVNTEEAAFMPESYEDILDDEFAGNAIIADFTPPPDSVIALLLNQGEDYLRQVADQQPQFVASLFDQVRRTAQGEAKLAWQCLGSQAIQFQNRGLPIELAPNNELWVWAAQWMQIAENPPHPWAARLYTDFLIRPEHRFIQTGRIGSMSLDFGDANPNRLLNLFDPDENEVWSAKKYPDSVNTLLDQYLAAMGAPV